MRVIVDRYNLVEAHRGDEKIMRSTIVVVVAAMVMRVAEYPFGELLFAVVVRSIHLCDQVRVLFAGVRKMQSTQV